MVLLPSMAGCNMSRAMGDEPPCCPNQGPRHPTLTGQPSFLEGRIRCGQIGE